MGCPIIIYGESGSGKTRSLKNFAEDEILYINVENKPLSFRGKFKYSAKTDKINSICNQLSAMVEAGVKTAVVDDSTYIMTHLFMSKHSGMKMNDIYEIYNQIASSMYQLFQFIKTNLPDDVIVYVIMHEDSNDKGVASVQTLGKLLSQKVNLPGMVTITLHCIIDNNEHLFRVRSDGFDIAKSPEDMFEADTVPNDLKMIDKTIRDYYGL